MRRYAKTGQVQKLLAKLDPEVRAWCDQILSDKIGILAGNTAVAQLPRKLSRALGAAIEGKVQRVSRKRGKVTETHRKLSGTSLALIEGHGLQSSAPALKRSRISALAKSGVASRGTRSSD